MRRLFFLRRVFTVTLLAAGLVSMAPAADRPNIVFIFADDWGWGDLSSHGHPHAKTPNLDRLAAAGTEFYQFNVCNPVCSPSRTAVLTGHFPARHGVHQHFASVEHHQRCGMPDWLDPAAPMLPRMLKQAGYKTAHFGKWHLTNSHVPDAPLPTEYGYDETAVFNGPGPGTNHVRLFDDAIDFIRRHRDAPFFVNLWIHETHTPHYPTDESMKLYADLDEQHRAYAAVLSDADRRIGRLLDVLAKLGLEENTLVVFSSDNGPEITGPESRRKLGDETGPGLGTYFSVGQTGGLKGRKRSLFEGGVRLPFFVRWPGKVPAGRIDKSTVIAAVDLLPTLCAAAGAELPHEYIPDGQNMLPALLGEEIRREKPIFWEWRGAEFGDNWPRLAVRDGRWKLLMTADESRVELYDVALDRGENDNLARKHLDVVKRLSVMAIEWKASLPAEPPTNCMSKSRHAASGAPGDEDQVSCGFLGADAEGRRVSLDY